jgi:hypothetical protein
MKTLMMLNVFFKAIINHINEATGWGSGDPEYEARPLLAVRGRDEQR